MELHLPTVDHLLTRTPSVRRRLDLGRPVEPEVIEECLQIAVHAPTGGNAQSWRFIVVTDAAKRAELARIYRKAADPYLAANAAADRERGSKNERVLDSSVYLAEHLHEVPVHVIPCIWGRDQLDGGNVAGAAVYGSILPAVWSFQLALRSRGLGTVFTTLHLFHEQDAAELLGVPENVAQVGLLPVAYFTGDDFQPAKRRPAAELTYWDAWKAVRS